jgi:DNA excision repair protein ERCC-2
MESIVAAWNDMVCPINPTKTRADIHSCKGILNEVWKNKLIFVETPDANETSIALENYRRVRKSSLCDEIVLGRHSIFC